MAPKETTSAIEQAPVLDQPAAPPKTEQREKLKADPPAGDKPPVIDPKEAKKDIPEEKAPIEMEPISTEEIFGKVQEEVEEEPEKGEEAPAREEKSKENKGLRDQLTEANEALSSTKEEAAAIKQQLEDAKSELESFKSDIERRTKEASDQAALFDPTQHPEAQAIDKNFRDKMDGYLRSKEITIGRQQARKIKDGIGGLIADLQKINAIDDDAEHSAAGKRFREYVEDEFGAEADDVISLAQEGVQNYQQWSRKVEELGGKGEEVLYDQNYQAYRESLQSHKQMEESWFGLPEGFKEQSPNHPLAIIQDYRDDPDYKDIFEKSRDDTLVRGKRVFLPEVPMKPAELNAMSEEDKKKMLVERRVAKAQALSAEANLFGYYRDALYVLQLQQRKIDELSRIEEHAVNESPSPKSEDVEKKVQTGDEEGDLDLKPITNDEIWG